MNEREPTALNKEKHTINMRRRNSNFSEIKRDCNRYEFIKPLGRGKYSDVYEAMDPVEKRKVVIKLLKPVRKAKIGREISIL